MTKPGKGDATWYQDLATAQGGYVKSWDSVVSGYSGEVTFTERLMGMLTPAMTVLDAGCGSGEFTLTVAPKVATIIGFDFAEGMVEAATAKARTSQVSNATFLRANARDLEVAPSSFDLVYSRRGPTSILFRSDLLKPGGWMIGIHSHRQNVVRERLAASGLQDIEVDEYETTERFPNLEDFARYLSRIPGNPDYLAPEQGAALRKSADEHQDGDEYVVKHWRFVWQGRRQA